MIELRKALHAHIRSIHPRAYYRRAAETAAFPYLVYFLEVHDDGEGFGRVVLDIDGWDRPETGDTTPLENLMAAVNSGMNKTTLTTDSLAVSFYLNSKLALDDEDPRIKRRRYTYQGHMFERRE